VQTSKSLFEIFLYFMAFSAASGILSAVKSVLSFFQRQNLEHSLHGESEKTQSVVAMAVAIWKKPGFFESISLGRFLFDCGAVLTGMQYLQSLFPFTPLFNLGLITLLITFIIGHWIFPVLAQAFAPSLGPWAIRIYRIYSFLLMGKLGTFLFLTHDLAMRRLGIDPKLSFLGETDLQKMAPVADEDNPDRSGLEDDEKEMIRSIFDLRETQVKEIMTPRVDVIALPIGSSFSEVMEVINREKYSRIPIYKENLDHIQGILHTMDLISLSESARGADFNLSNMLREAYFVPRTKKIGELMREFRKKHIHMALVVDEYGGTAGLATLEDILEEIVGEIHDEDETETLKVRKIEDGIYLIDPIISLSDLNEEISQNLKPDDPDIQIDTLGGFILFVHGKVPEHGDIIRFKNFSFEIMEMDGQKMEKVRLTVSGMVNP
jgi:putative hemolysin